MKKILVKAHPIVTWQINGAWVKPEILRNNVIQFPRVSRGLKEAV